MLALLYPIALGLGRIEATHLLKRNGVFQYLTGLSAYPDATTLRRFFLRIVPRTLASFRKLHDKFLSTMAQQPRLPVQLVFDLDSTVLTLYGKQEMARRGYNPHKRGRVSYHPLLCFNGLTKDFWHGELRPGDTHTATGVIELLKASFAKVPPSVRRVLIRADKGFYDHKAIEYLESQKAFFVIAAKLTQPIKRKLHAPSYQRFTSGTHTAEFFYQPHGWNKQYRFIVIRRPITEESTAQLSLFSTGKYSYQVLVTNLTLTPLNTWKLYNERASVELIIKELKADYPLAKIPTRWFAANETYFHLLLFTYNLINWFKRLCLPEELHAMTLSTLRSRLLFIPAELRRIDNKPTLKLLPNLPYQDAIKFAINKIHKLRF